MKQALYRILVPMSYISLLDVNIRHPRGVQGVQKRAQRRPEGAQECQRSLQKAQRCVLQLKMGPRRHPRGVQGVQNEPKCVPEASRRRPRMSKKRPGGAKFDLVLFYSVFKRLYGSKWDPEGIPEASRASKMSANAPQKRPEDVQERQRSVQMAQSSV